MANKTDKALDTSAMEAVQEWSQGLFYKKPSGGIPKADLATAVQTALDNAESITPISKATIDSIFV